MHCPVFHQRLVCTGAIISENGIDAVIPAEEALMASWLTAEGRHTRNTTSWHVMLLTLLNSLHTKVFAVSKDLVLLLGSNMQHKSASLLHAL